MSFYLRIFILLLLVTGALGIGYLWGHQHGKQSSTDIVAAHSRVYGSVKMASELANKTGYKSDGNSSAEMTVLEFEDIKDFRYYIVEINGVKTVASHEE